MLALNLRGEKPQLSGALVDFASVVPIVIAAAAVLVRAGLPLAAAVTSAALSALVCRAFGWLFGSPSIELVPNLSVLVLLCVYCTQDLGGDWRLTALLGLVTGLAIILLASTGLLRLVARAIPAEVVSGMTMTLALLTLLYALSLCGIITQDDSGAFVLASIYSPDFVDATISVLAMALLTALGIPAAPLLGVLVGTFAGVPLGLTQLSGGLAALPDLSSAQDALTFLTRQGGLALDSLLDPESLAMAVTLLLLCTSHAGEGRREGVCQGASLALCSLIGVVCLPRSGGRCRSRDDEVGVHASRRALLACLLLLLTFFSPLAAIVPTSAVLGPLLLAIHGSLRHQADFDWEDLTQALPAIAVVMGTLFGSSLALGSSFAMLTWCLFAICKDGLRSLNPGNVVLALLSLAFLLATSGL